MTVPTVKRRVAPAPWGQPKPAPVYEAGPSAQQQFWKFYRWATAPWAVCMIAKYELNPAHFLILWPGVWIAAYLPAMFFGMSFSSTPTKRRVN